MVWIIDCHSRETGSIPVGTAKKNKNGLVAQRQSSWLLTNRPRVRTPPGPPMKKCSIGVTGLAPLPSKQKGERSNRSYCTKKIIKMAPQSKWIRHRFLKACDCEFEPHRRYKKIWTTDEKMPMQINRQIVALSRQRPRSITVLGYHLQKATSQKSGLLLFYKVRLL